MKIANIAPRFVLSLYQSSLTNINFYCFQIENNFFPLINKKYLKLMKKCKYFYHWQLEYIIFNYCKKINKAVMIAKIADIAMENNKISGRR